MERSHVLLQKNKAFLRSFPFFIKERGDLCVLSRSLQKKGTFFTFFPVLFKRTGKNVPFFWVSYVAKNSKKERERTGRSLKEWERPGRSERERTRCPTLNKNEPFFRLPWLARLFLN